jgi:hypothetical protein
MIDRNEFEEALGSLNLRHHAKDLWKHIERAYDAGILEGERRARTQPARPPLKIVTNLQR